MIGVLAVGMLSACAGSQQENTENVAQTKEITVETEAGADKEPDVEDVKVVKSEGEDADTYYEMGQASLYGLDGQKMDFEAANTYFEQAIEKGKVEANFYLGVLCYWFSYPKQDFEKAKYYFEAAGNNPYAQLSLGLLYYNGQVGEKDIVKGQELIDSVIADGYADGYLGIGEIAFENENYADALEYFTKAAEEGQEQVYVARAMNCLGWMYANGFEVEQNYTKAMEWFEKSSELGYPPAMFHLGNMYEYIISEEERDYSIAIEWYEKSAELGFSYAMYALGRMYCMGIGVEIDYTKAVEWYEKAVELGNGDAMNDIGFLYGEGLGVEQDYARALEWFQKSAELGNNDAMNNIGYFYENGLGVEQDYARALEWFQKSAELGNTNAMNNIGYLYENGLGVEQDYAKAQEWYNKANMAD